MPVHHPSYKATLLAVTLVAVTAICPYSLGRQRVQTQTQPIIILAEMRNGRVAYKVDSKPALPDLLRVLNVMGDQLGRDCQVIALVDSRAPINEIGNIDGTAGKAGFTNLRFFVFNKEAETMGTIQFGPTLPFSANPPVN